jgi:predicted secreted protein
VSWLNAFFVYLVIWWTVLFAVLPLGARSYHDAGVAPPPGCDPGAPMEPNLLRKFITTSWISAIVLAVLWAIVAFKLVPLPNVPQIGPRG